MELLKKTSGIRRKSSRRNFEIRKDVRHANVKVTKSGSNSIPNFKINSIGLGKNLESYNPTLKSILKVEELFLEIGEFDSRTQLIRELGGSMKIQVLDVILKYLKSLGMVLDNPDGSWTWIFAKNNEKLKESWKKATQL
jgi:hypothetical protein